MSLFVYSFPLLIGSVNFSHCVRGCQVRGFVPNYKCSDGELGKVGYKFTGYTRFQPVGLFVTVKDLWVIFFALSASNCLILLSKRLVFEEER